MAVEGASLQGGWSLLEAELAAMVAAIPIGYAMMTGPSITLGAKAPWRCSEGCSKA
jgi:hypothetical protein